MTIFKFSTLPTSLKKGSFHFTIFTKLRMQTLVFTFFAEITEKCRGYIQAFFQNYRGTVILKKCTLYVYDVW